MTYHVATKHNPKMSGPVLPGTNVIQAAIAAAHKKRTKKKTMVLPPPQQSQGLPQQALQGLQNAMLLRRDSRPVG